MPTEPMSYQRVAERGRAQVSTDFMWGVYRWMAVGLAVTGFVSMAVASSEQAMQLVYGNRMAFFVMLIVQFGMVVAFSSVAQRASTAVVGAMFLAYSALTGVTLSVIFLIYTSTSIAQVFFVTAGSFAALSFYGTVTKRDLTGMGRFMFMGLIGIVIASLVNIFLHSPAVSWVASCAGVLVFAGLTAYETQRLREIHAVSGGAGNLALRGALTLYLDFINLFLSLLRLFGNRRD